MSLIFRSLYTCYFKEMIIMKLPFVGLWNKSPLSVTSMSGNIYAGLIPGRQQLWVTFLLCFLECCNELCPYIALGGLSIWIWCSTPCLTTTCISEQSMAITYQWWQKTLPQLNKSLVTTFIGSNGFIEQLLYLKCNLTIL